MNKSLKLAVYTSLLWLFLILLYVINVVDPVSAGPVGILFVFILIYLIVASLLFVVLHGGIGLVATYLSKRGNESTSRSIRLGAKKAYYMASVVAFAPVLLLALNSVRQLGPTDILLTVLFLFIVIFYISKKS